MLHDPCHIVPLYFERMSYSKRPDGKLGPPCILLYPMKERCQTHCTYHILIGLIILEVPLQDPLTLPVGIRLKNLF